MQPFGSREAVVANVFISHTGADIGWAQQIHQWLLEDAHKVFLDSDQAMASVQGRNGGRAFMSD